MFRNVLRLRSATTKTTVMMTGATVLLLTNTTSALSSSKTYQESPKVQKLGTESSFSFGVIADVQWADTEDGYNYAKTVKRCYRGAFQTLGNAVDWWCDQSSHNNINLSFIAQLGDIVDGINVKLKESDVALQKAIKELDRAPCPSINIIGNHELYNFDRTELTKASWLRHGNKEFYSISPSAGWRVIVLDPYQIALIGHSRDDPRRKEAVELLAKENPNISPDGAGGRNWYDGIEGYQRRFVPYNGGFGKEQLDWFASELALASVKQERVIVLSHVIIHPKACAGGTMAWDYEKALDIIHSINNSNDVEVVIAVLCGHDHRGFYYQDETGVHHCTFSSPLNKGSKGKAFGMIKVSPNTMEIVGPYVDDFLPDVPGRPPKKSCDENVDGDSILGPCESIILPFGQRKQPSSSSTITDEQSFVIR